MQVLFPSQTAPLLSSTSLKSDLLCEFSIDHNFMQLIDSPTHISGHILDLVITNSSDLVKSVEVVLNTQFRISTDHHLVCCSLRALVGGLGLQLSCFCL